MPTRLITPPAGGLAESIASLDAGSGIYAIRCINNGRIYVGSALHLNGRMRRHICSLRKGTHHSALLQNAWNKYGDNGFYVEVLARVQPDELISAEQTEIDRFKAADRKFGFNISPTAGSPLGRKYSIEIRQKISERLIGNAHNLGKKISDETRAKLIEIRKGRTPAKGMRHSAETKAKISIALTGTVATEQRKRLISQALTGRKQSASHRLNLAVSQTLIKPEMAREIIRAYGLGGTSMKKLSEIYSCSAQTICNVIHRKRIAYKCLHV